MKVLVATRALQLDRVDELFECREGEFVWLAPLCPSSRANSGSCSCRTTFAGLSSGGRTTTAEVVDLPTLTPGTFSLIFWSIHSRECTCPINEATVAKLLADADRWPVGSVLERRGPRLVLRGYAPTQVLTDSD
jgi:hypothetical protein